MARKKPFNPFYVLLVIAGAAFAVTACAYGITAMRALRPNRAVAESPPQSAALTEFIDKHGNRLLVGELVVLAIATVGAISTDGYWTRRAAADRTPTENQP
jgi:hypothetical protein